MIPRNECFVSPSSQIFCASVQKAMLGSSRWNKAHDLERKLGPWKQASVMWLPWRLIEPPSCTASSGRGIWKREMWQPAITFSTPGQWRWWAASISVWQRRLGEVDVGRWFNSDLNMRHAAGAIASNLWNGWCLCFLFLMISWACLITFSCWTTLSTVWKSGIQIKLIRITNNFASYNRRDRLRHLQCHSLH